MNYKKKLIEVALPLEAINKASAREKSIRHGHPSTLHLWWARRPLAAARAVIFSQMVDDPSAHPERFSTDEAQEAERQRLFGLIEELVQWENTANEAVLSQAREEIWKSWGDTCEANKDHSRAKDLFDPKKLPAFHDPFAGGGALPHEAQRLGLEAYASDLNPVAVLINKAMIEIPPKFAGLPPVNPEAQRQKAQMDKGWRGAQGLAEDLRYYGRWMRNEAEKRVGYLYPQIEVTVEMSKKRPDLNPFVGCKLTVIAWLWARTVKSPNPAFAQMDVPLASTFMLATKSGKEAYVEPVIETGSYRFTVRVGKPRDENAAKNGTKLSRGANFRCLMSGSPIAADYIRSEAQAGRLGTRLMAIVAEGKRGRVYLPPTPEMEKVAQNAKPDWKPEVEFFQQALGFRVGNYGMTKWSDLFTNRQLVVLTTFSRLVQEAKEKINGDAAAAAMPADKRGLASGGTGAIAYAEAIATFLAFGVSRSSDYWSNLCIWRSDPKNLGVGHVFSKQTLSMVWDFAEGNPLSESSGNWLLNLDWVAKVIERLGVFPPGQALQSDARTVDFSMPSVVSTDPPYFDNVGYADLSDFFYVWLRFSLRTVFPDLFATLATPKSEELVATPARHGGLEAAERFFLEGMTLAIHRIGEQAHPAFPVTIYYAFKQSENDVDGTASTGWETFLDAVIRAGFAISGTWPMRTELGNRTRSMDSNALASSIVLVCRPREANARIATRREFVADLKSELPVALAHLQRGNIAPVDLAQAAIGPGMAVYTRYGKVLDAEGNPLSVREALALINQILDEALAEQEGDFDADSRWALAWFEQNGFSVGEFGVADVLARAKNTSVGGMVKAGVIASSRGKVRLLKPEELAEDWDPTADARPTAWEVVHQLVRALAQGEQTAADVVAKLGGAADLARELAYRLYALCERNKRAQEALAYNALVQCWPELVRLAAEVQPEPMQPDLI
jgi:putative DNA methylase